MAVIFCGFISYLFCHETISIQENLSGFHGFRERLQKKSGWTFPSSNMNIQSCLTDMVYRQYNARTFFWMLQQQQKNLFKNCFTCRNIQLEMSKLDMSTSSTLITSKKKNATVFLDKLEWHGPRVTMSEATCKKKYQWCFYGVNLRYVF